jgi:hypothetical protein
MQARDAPAYHLRASAKASAGDQVEAGDLKVCSTIVLHVQTPPRTVENEDTFGPSSDCPSFTRSAHSYGQRQFQYEGA